MKAKILSACSIAGLTCALLASIALAQSSSGATAPEANEPARLVRIRHISLIRQNVFTSEEKRIGILANTPYLEQLPYGSQIQWLTGPDKLDIAGWANRLHFKTQPPVIYPELLFHEGDPLDYSLLSETERNLRDLGIFRAASVTSSQEENGSFDVNVTTQDSWTTNPEISFALLGGGSATGGGGIAEYNLFGFGKAAEIFESSELYRTVSSIGYDDPRIWETHWHARLEGTEDSDGRFRQALVEYPFWSLEVPTGAGSSLSDVTDRERDFSENSAIFRHIQTDIYGALQRALVAQSDQVDRVGLGYVQWGDSFEQGPHERLGLENRRTSALYLSLLDWRPDFVKAQFLDQLGHIEDRDVGRAFAINAGYSPIALGATRNEFALGSTLQQGFHLGDQFYSWLWIQTAGRYGAGHLRDAYLTVEPIAYWRLHPYNQTLVADMRADLSSGLFADHEFVAGGDSGGQRAYPVNFEGGTRRLLFHVEDRVPIVQELFHLLSLGGVVFFDAGDVWGRQTSRINSSTLLATIGCGLRIAGTRSTLQIPVRIDFGIPLIHHVGVDPVNLITGGGQAFGQFGQPFFATDNALTDQENFAPDTGPSPYPNASPFVYPGATFTDF